MFTFHIEEYLSHYTTNANRISVKKFRYSLKGDTFEKVNLNIDFDLHFNNKCLLLEVIHFKRRIEKSTVFYNKENQIIKIIKSRWSTNEILSEIDAGYDEQNRLIYESEKLDFYSDKCIYAQEIFYTYEGNIRTTDIYCEDDEEHYIITDVFDNDGNIIETKAAEEDGELKYWQKDLFDENNKYIRTLNLNEDDTEIINNHKVEPEDIYEEKFYYNDRNDWIVKEVYRNNILKESTERSITYY